jgi:regulator of sirC expression with transglutaminase-like and TPR domain
MTQQFVQLSPQQIQEIIDKGFVMVRCDTRHVID